MLLMQLQISWEESHLPLLLAFVRSRLRQVSLHYLSPYGLTPQQYQVMSILERHPGICHKDLAGSVGMDKPTATRVLQTLQKKDWVRVQHVAGHRRKLCIDLSPEGRRLIAQLEGFRQFFREKLEEGLEPSERQQLRDLLKKLSINLDRLEQISLSSK